MKRLDYVRETFKKKSFIIKERTPQKRKGDSCMGRFLHDNERAFPNEIPRSLSESQEARTGSQRSQESEPGARAGCTGLNKSAKYQATQSFVSNLFKISKMKPSCP